MKLCSETTRLRLGFHLSFEHFVIMHFNDGKLLSICYWVLLAVLRM